MVLGTLSALSEPSELTDFPMPTRKSAKKTTKSAAKTAPAAKAKTSKAPSAEPKGLETQSPFAVPMKESILRHLNYTQARDRGTATARDWQLATSLAVRDRVLDRLIKTQSVHNDNNARRLYYLSLEYLMGRLLISTLQNAGVYAETRAALEELGVDWEEMRRAEDDMGLGNGGLGRLAACFLDSLATLDLPAIGYGINYEFGLFRQAFDENGNQIEHPDSWMMYGTAWEFMHPEYQQEVKIYGHVENIFDDQGNYRPTWVNTHTLIGVPHDIPVPGFGTETVNILRLWASHATEQLDLSAFNEGGYVEAVRQKATSETVSKVLYPNDKTENGKELRLVQQYFFVACSMRDLIRRHFRIEENSWDNFADKVAIQLNDTHPAIAVAELMRILVDEENMDWDKAWSIVTATFAYTNHTLLPEALEKWSIGLFERVLPRHLQLIFEINRRHLEEVAAKWPGDVTKLSECSLVEENGGKQLRMAHLAVVGSHAVNGVAALHTELLKKDLFPYFDALYPGKFRNKTNGITPRRWLNDCNPRLSALISNTLGHEKWVRNLDLLQDLGKHADDKTFQKEFMAIKRANKVDLANLIKELCDVEVSPDALFDVQIKRLHEYKRQHLNLLHIVALYRRLLQNPDLDVPPRVFIFAAKAAPGYDLAKNIIRAINVIGKRINNDQRINGKLKVVFLPNYRVSLAERIIPAADLSEQISTAGKEASGTGNMKLALNGALTIGTLDGANVEIKEEVGDDNIFIFGMTVEEVEARRAAGYNPYDFYYADEELRAVLEWIESDYFVPGEHHAFGQLYHSLLNGGDPFMVLADFRAYSDAHLAVDAAYRDPKRWAKMAILNTARVGKFSSDRTISEYAEDIWKLPNMPLE